MQLNRQKTTLKKKITYFLKNYVASLFIFLKSLCNLQIFYRLLFRSRILRPFAFYLFEVQSTVLIIFFFAGRKCVDLVVIFNKGREETFAVSLQNRKTYVCMKYLTLVRPRKLTAVNFTFLYSM